MRMRQGELHESAPASLGEHVPITDNRIQVLLALRVVNEGLPGLNKKVLQYEDADADTKKAAIAKWLEGETSLSVRYRAFIEDPAHTALQVNVHDAKALDALLETIRAYSVTMH